jgi:hypothetical protein
MNETIEELSKELNYYETALIKAKKDKDNLTAHEKTLSNTVCITKDKILKERNKQQKLLKDKEKQAEEDRKAHALEQIQSQTISKMYIERENHDCGYDNNYVIETMEGGKYIIKLIWTGYEDAEMELDYYDKGVKL